MDMNCVSCATGRSAMKSTPSFNVVGTTRVFVVANATFGIFSTTRMKCGSAKFEPLNSVSNPVVGSAQLVPMVSGKAFCLISGPAAVARRYSR